MKYTCRSVISISQDYTRRQHPKNIFTNCISLRFTEDRAGCPYSKVVSNNQLTRADVHVKDRGGKWRT